MAKYLQELKPDGGTVCMQLGNVAANNINERAAGFRDTIAGAMKTERLTGQGGWTEIDGCPLYTNDDITTANQQMADTFTANPDLGAFILVGGWAAVRPRGLRFQRRPGEGQARLKGAHHHRRRHAAAADGCAEGRAQPRPDRPAAVRDGLSGAETC